MATSNTKNSKNPYTPEIQSGIRITVLLIEVATKVLQDFFDKCIKEKNLKLRLEEAANYNSLDHFLNQNKSIIKNLKPKLYKFQLETLYVNNNSANNYDKIDLCLCFRLLRFILRQPKNGWDFEPDENEEPLLASVVFIKLIRNKNFAHICDMKCDVKQLERLSSMSKNAKKKDFSLVALLEWSIYTLAEFINGPGSDSLNELRSKIDDFLLKPMTRSEFDRYRELSSNIMIDQETVDMIRNYCQISLKNNQQVMDLLSKIEQSESTREENIKQLIKENQNKLFRLIKNVQISISDIYMNYWENGFKKIDAHFNDLNRQNSDFRRTDQEILEASGQNLETSEQILDSVRNIESHLAEHRIGFESNYDYQNLEDFKGYFQSQKELYFRILILDVYETKVDSERLIESVAKSEWNVIIEINNPKSSLEFDICENLSKNYIKETPASLEKVKDLNCVFNKEHVLYLKLSVFDENNDENQLDPLNALELNFFSKIPKFLLENQTIVCANFLFRGLYDIDSLKNTYDINRRFNDSLKKSRHQLKIKKSEQLDCLFFFPTDLENLRDIPDSEISKIHQDKFFSKYKKYTLKYSSEQIFTALFSCSPNYIGDDFLLPGKDGCDITWTNNDNKLYCAYFEVYHKKIGEIRIESLNDKEAYFKEKKYKFIIGNEIDPETIYMNDDLKPVAYQTYVKIELMDKLYEEISAYLKKNVYFKNNPLMREIKHLPSCGGTTIGKVLLYRLRKEVPCVRLKYFDKEDVLIEGLRKISSSGLPIVIVIDSDSKWDIEYFDYMKVKDFSQTLFNLSLKHFIIYPHQSFTEPDIQKLTNLEIKAYEDLYADYLNTNTSGKVKIYSNLINIRLMYLKEENNQEMDKNIKELCNNYLKNIPERHRELLIIMLYFYKFSNEKYITNGIVSYFLKTNNRKSIADDFIKFIEDPDPKNVPIFFYLMRFHIEIGFTIIDSRIGEKLVPLICDNPMEKCYDILIKTFKDEKVRNNESLMEQLLYFARRLFTFKTQEEDESETFEHSFDCKFICESIERIGIKQTRSQLEQLTEIYLDYYKNSEDDNIPYLIAFTANFIFHKFEGIMNKQKGIEYIKKALKVNNSIQVDYRKLPPNSKKSDILRLYGDLFRHYKVQRYRDKATSKELLELAKESCFAYSKALDLNENNLFALVGECKLRKNVINQFKDEISKKDGDLDEFVRNSFYVIIRNMDKIKDLNAYALFKIDYDELYQKCVIDILDNVYQMRQPENIFLKIETKYKLDTFQTIKAWLIRRSKERNQQENIDWKDLEINHLDLIIERCKKQLDKQISTSSNDFRNILNAYIYKSMKENQSDNILHAITRADQWVDKYPNEPDSHYYYAIFNLISWIDSDKLENLKKAGTHFRKCKEIYQRMKNPSAPKKYKNIEFMIGKEIGLKKLIQFSDDTPGHCLHEFKEELVDLKKDNNKYTPIFKLEREIDLICLGRNSSEENFEFKVAERGQHKYYRFFISISRQGLIMHQYRPLSKIYDPHQL